MATFRRCDESVAALAATVLCKHDTHKPLIDAKLRIDYVFAFGDVDEATGEITSDALTLHGSKALGICRKIQLKDRALGRADAEIAIDGDWWAGASEAEREALLDHELHHIAVLGQRDDLGRPKIRLRHHDYQFGWFTIIAARNGAASQERIQAKSMMDAHGQLFWPSLTDQAQEQFGRFGKVEINVHRK